MKRFIVLTICLMTLATLAMPFASAAETQKCAVLIDYGNGNVSWVDVDVTSSMNMLNATQVACTELGLTLVAPDGFVSSIGDYPMAWPNEWWHFWTWNSTISEWDVSWVGAADVTATDHTAIAWSYVQDKSDFSSDKPLATPDHRYPWTTFRHDLLGSGSAPYDASNNISLGWSVDLGNGAIDAPVIVAGGYEYVVTGGVLNMSTYAYDTDSAIYCLNATGATVWHASIGRGYQVGAPLLVSDMVIVPSANGKLYAFNAKTGAAEWTFDTGTAATYGITSSPVAYRNNIYFAATNGTLYSINYDGEQNGFISMINSYYSTSPMIKDGIVYIGGDDGYLHAFDAEDLLPIWEVALGGKVRGTPILTESGIIVTYINYTSNAPVGGGLACVGYDGAIVWQTDLGVSPASAALTNNGYAVMTSTGMSMVSTAGKVKWTLSLGTSFAGAAPAAIKGTIFAVTNEESSRLVAVSDAGELYWQTVLLPAQYALCAPTISDGKLFVTSDNGKVYAFDLASKQENTLVIDFNVNGKVVDMSAIRPANYSLYTYTWSWGDGNFSKGTSVNHTYAQDGTYTVILTLSAPDGTSSTFTKDVKVDTSAKVNDTLLYVVVAIIAIALVVVALILVRRKK